MKKFITTIFLPLLLVSCDHIGSTRVKNLIDLTPHLEVETATPLAITSGKSNPFAENKPKAHKIAKSTIIAKPAIAQSIMYSLDKKGYVSAFSLKTKKILWMSDIAKESPDHNFNTGGVLFSDGKLYVTYGSRYLVILDSINGHELIRKEFPDILRSQPVMANDKILLVQTISNQTLAYDVHSAKLVWLHEGGLETISTKNNVHPVVYNGYALISYSSGEVVYLNVNTGEEKWHYSLTNTGDVGLPSFDPSVIVTTPIISGEYVYFATSNGKIVKIDLDNGAPVWLKDANDIQSMSLIDGYLFVTNNARQVAALSAHDGKVNWVGDLISEKDRKSKRPPTTLFQEPFISKTEHGFAINVIASSGELFQFNTEKDGTLPAKPSIISINKDARYYWISCCSGKLHLISNYNVSF